MYDSNYHLDDVSYMRWFEGDKVLRVARLIPNGSVVALYPNADASDFGLECFREIDDPNNRVPIAREKIKDRIFLALLDGRTIEEILKEYEPTPMAEGHEGDNKYSYYVVRKGGRVDLLRTPTFHISDDSQEEVVSRVTT